MVQKSIYGLAPGVRQKSNSFENKIEEIKNRPVSEFDLSKENIMTQLHDLIIKKSEFQNSGLWQREYYVSVCGLRNEGTKYHFLVCGPQTKEQETKP